MSLNERLPLGPFVKAPIVGKNKTALTITPRIIAITYLIPVLINCINVILFSTAYKQHSNKNQIPVKTQLIPAIYQLKIIAKPTAIDRFQFFFPCTI